MGWIAIVIRAIKAAKEVVCDPGGGANITALRSGSPGDDSQPHIKDTVILVAGQRNGEKIAVGFIDSTGAVANSGEKRIYAWLPDGTIMCSLHLKLDGSAVFENSLGKFELKPDGSFDLNGVTIDVAGNMVVKTIIDQGGIGLGTHKHGGVLAGGQVSGPAVP